MSGRVGVELSPGIIRVVRLAPVTGRVTHSFELPWDPSRPADAVAAVRGRLPRPDSLTLAVGLGFLEIARVDLPPVSSDQRARIVELEPDRYFAASPDAIVCAPLPSAPVACALAASTAAAWADAFEGWAPVRWVEPAPLAIARALGPRTTGTFKVPAAPGETGLLELKSGRIVAVRRTRDLDAGAPDLPSVGGVGAPWVAALGAARYSAFDDGSAPALATTAWRRRLTSRRRTARTVLAAVTLAALGFAGWAADGRRERTLRAVEALATEVAVRSAPAESALRVLRLREAEAATVTGVLARRANPFRALAVLSSALPRDAVVLSARATGNHWQLDGTTSDASALVPLLDRHALLDSVRFLSASSRFRESNRSYETFSIALRFQPRP